MSVSQDISQERFRIIVWVEQVLVSKIKHDGGGVPLRPGAGEAKVEITTCRGELVGTCY